MSYLYQRGDFKYLDSNGHPSQEDWVWAQPGGQEDQSYWEQSKGAHDRHKLGDIARGVLDKRIRYKDY